MRRFLLWAALALAVMTPALMFRLIGVRPDPLLDAGVFGAAILAAGFMLSWGAEAAEHEISQGLILAGVALITVLPEYSVDLYYAFQAGDDPRYVHYAAANMTGANRLLVGLAWPLLAIVHWSRTRERAIPLCPVNGVEIGFLLLASLYAFVILLKRSIHPLDFIVLAVIFFAYLWRVSRLPKAGPEEAEGEVEPGPAAVLNMLPPTAQWIWMGALVTVAAAVIFLCAEPFAESMVDSGRRLGVDEFLLIQWLAPLASEAPAVSIAVLFVLAGRSAGGLTTMISDKINQWTLLVGMLPLAMSLGAGAFNSLPLDMRQQEEFFLTAAQSLFGVGLLLRYRLGLVSALVLAGLFLVQVSLAFAFRDDQGRTILALTALAWVYLGLAALLFAMNGRRLVATVRTALDFSRPKSVALPLESSSESRPVRSAQNLAQDDP